MMVKLPPSEVHLWYFRSDAGSAGDEVSGRLSHLLSSEERARRDQLSFEPKRHEFIASRAFLRLTLSRYAEVRPEDWKFSSNEYGRPEISGADQRLGLRFNLSHCHGMIACAVVVGRDIGVDVEDVSRETRFLDIARSVFSESELRELEACSPERRKERFFEYWTLKESYIKARGLGLSLPLGGFSFSLGQEKGVRISFGPGIPDDPECWQFELQKLSARHQAALAIGREAGEGVLRVIVREFVLGEL